MACTEHGERHLSMSHCRRGGGVFPAPLRDLRVIGLGSVIFRFRCRLRAVCVLATACVWACMCVCAGLHHGSGGEACLAGRLAQLLSSCLRQPLEQSGLSGKPPLERHQSRHARVGKKKIKKEPKSWGCLGKSQSCGTKTQQSSRNRNQVPHRG